MNIHDCTLDQLFRKVHDKLFTYEMQFGFLAKSELLTKYNTKCLNDLLDLDPFEQRKKYINMYVDLRDRLLEKV